MTASWWQKHHFNINTIEIWNILRHSLRNNESPINFMIYTSLKFPTFILNLNACAQDFIIGEMVSVHDSHAIHNKDKDIMRDT